MNVDRLSFLVEKLGFDLLCWEDRYGKGVWAVCLPGYSRSQAVRDASEDGDMEMFAATEYLLEPDWLPIVTGHTLREAVSLLEARLGALDAAQLARGSDWHEVISAVLEHFLEVQEASMGKAYRDYRPLPEDFRVIARAVELCRKANVEVTW